MVLGMTAGLHSAGTGILSTLEPGPDYPPGSRITPITSAVPRGCWRIFRESDRARDLSNHRPLC